MVIIGWLFLLAVACYATFSFFVGNIVSNGFSGKLMEWQFNVILVIVMGILWYFVVTEFPFMMSIK